MEDRLVTKVGNADATIAGASYLLDHVLVLGGLVGLGPRGGGGSGGYRSGSTSSPMRKTCSAASS